MLAFLRFQVLSLACDRAQKPSPLCSLFPKNFLRGSFFYVAADTKVECYAHPQHRPCTEGQNQEPPDHPHDALGYQNKAGTCVREWISATPQLGMAWYEFPRSGTGLRIVLAAATSAPCTSSRPRTEPGRAR